jgi:hypothetical protein
MFAFSPSFIKIRNRVGIRIHVRLWCSFLFPNYQFRKVQFSYLTHSGWNLSATLSQSMGDPSGAVSPE